LIAGRLTKVFGVMLFSSLLATAVAVNSHPVAAYTPQKGDYFHYSETITVNNGQGYYTGYTDQTQVSGMEQMNSVNGSTVSASYSYSYQYSSNQGSSTSNSSSGKYTWSPGSFTYVNGTDDQVGYSKPTYVWFAMNTALPVGGTFYVLNTQFTVLSKNYSLQLPTKGNEYVQTIQTEGTGQHQRSDSYGVFTASYTYHEYFDPTTGYVVGYNYVEQDTGQYQGQAGNFTYTDDLYVTSTSYNLVLASVTGSLTANAGSGSTLYLVYSASFLAVVVIVAVVVYAATRRRGKGESLPRHPQYTPPPSTPGESRIDLGSRPSEQVVIREVAKVNCKYCGTLIPSTADTCPYCGGPRQ